MLSFLLCLDWERNGQSKPLGIRITIGSNSSCLRRNALTGLKAIYEAGQVTKDHAVLSDGAVDATNK